MTDLIGRTLHRLGQQLRGRLSLPGDDRYVAATAIWAKPVGRMPRGVAHCRTREDVQLAIRVGRDCDLPLSVRGGGHDWAGRALCDGIVVDLSGMNAVVVGSDNLTARISGGARASDVLAVTGPLGLAAVTGSVGAVGIAGLTLGRRLWTADRPLRTCARQSRSQQRSFSPMDALLSPMTTDEEELFWALRGGGGNFGVVTAMRHRLHNLPSVRSGMLIYPFFEAKAVLEGCADIGASAPEELTFQLGFVAGPDGAPVVMIVPTWCGAPEDGEGRVAPFLKLGDAARQHGGRDALWGRADCVRPISRQWATDIHGDVLACRARQRQHRRMIRAMETAVSPGCAIFTHEFKGAASRVPAEATAFGLRRDHVLVEILAAFVDHSDEIEEQRHRQWARATLRAFHAIALPGGYPNLLPATDDADRVAKSYGRNVRAAHQSQAALRSQ